MRFLFSFVGGTGHYVPLIPFARSLRVRGHEVLFTCQEAMVARVAADGWRVEPSGGNTLLARETRRPLAPVDRLAEERGVRRTFAGSAARERAARLTQLVAGWKPDVVVRDEVDFAAALVSEKMAVPHAMVVVTAAGGFIRAELVAAPLAALAAEHGIDWSDDLLSRHLVLAPVPPSFRDPTDPLPATARSVQPAVLEELSRSSEPSRTRRGRDRARPHVFVTLGTIFPQESGDLFERTLQGVTQLDVDVTVAIGEVLDRDEVGRQPPNVTIERVVPLGAVLSASDAVVSHGGSGTVVSAVALGLPQVVLPMGADQPLNGDRCAELGLGIVVDALGATPSDIAVAVQQVLDTPRYAASARRLAEEVRALPDAEFAADLLERL